MATGLIQALTDASSTHNFSCFLRQGLDRRRIFRVLDHIEANLEGDLTIDSMASVAGLSRYHFARAFKKAPGQSPHRYVSARRLGRAKTLLPGDRSLVEIALALGFSSQASSKIRNTRHVVVEELDPKTLGVPKIHSFAAWKDAFHRVCIPKALART